MSKNDILTRLIDCDSFFLKVAVCKDFFGTEGHQGLPMWRTDNLRNGVFFAVPI
jgi:hypothetical protein